MPQFRGIEKEDILSSIEAAIDFLKDQDIGPLCNPLIEEAQNEVELNRIRIAKTDEQLRYALNAAEATDVIRILDKALLYHAQVNTNGTGFDIYNNLSRWGGIGGARDFGLSHEDLEIEDYIATLPELDIYAPLPGLEHAFDMYGVVLRDAAIGLETSPEEVKAVSARISKLLESHWETGDVQASGGQGVVGKWTPGASDHKWGAPFMCTKNVAQAVADAFPEYTVVNSKDDVIAPSQAQSHADTVTQRRAAGGERTR